MFSKRIRRGKRFATEQKIREFKKLLVKSKSIDRRVKKKVKPNQLIKKATNNLNNTKSLKHGLAPE